MEASGAGLAGAGTAAGSDGAGQAGEQQQQGDGQAPGDGQIAQLAQQLTSLESGQEQMREFLQGIAQQQEGDGQQEQQEQPLPDLSAFDATAPGYSEEQAAQALQQLMRTEASSEAQRLMQETVTPLQEQVADMRRQQETDALIGRYPDLGDEKVAEAVVGTAQRYASALGQPELVGNSQFVELVYLAGRAAEYAQQQDGAGDGAVATLEGAGGARPGSAAQGANTAEALAEKWGQRNNVLSKL